MNENLKTSEKGKELIKQFEGVVYKVYLDVAGYKTVGVGHLVKPSEKYSIGQRVTPEEVDRLLTEDLKIAEYTILKNVSVPLNQNQFDALVSLVFNIGASRFKESSVLRNLNAGNYSKAADCFLLFTKIRKGGKLVPSKGLQRRRQAERALFLTPVEEPSEPMPAENSQETSSSTEEKKILSEESKGGSSLVETYEESKKIVSSVGDNLNFWANNFSSIETSKAVISRSSLFTTIISHITGYLLLFFSIVKENIEITVLAIVLILAGLLYLHFSKKRATERLKLTLTQKNEKV